MMHDGDDKMTKMAAEVMTDEEMESDFIESGQFPGSKERLAWHLGNDGVLVISGLGKVPDFSCGRNPAPPWEDKKELIRELVIREGVDEIGIRAFEGCRNLKKVIFPETLCRINAYAFAGCTLLDQILIPEGVHLCHIYEDVRGNGDEEILCFGVGSFYRTPWALNRWGKYYIREGILYACFSDDSHLELPPEIHTINKFAFACVTSDTVTIPNTVTSVRNFAFSSSHLKSVTIPESIGRDEIGDYAFMGTELTRVDFLGSCREVRRALIDQLPGRQHEGGPDDLIRIPDIYEITLNTERQYSPFRKIMVGKIIARKKKQKKKPVEKPEENQGKNPEEKPEENQGKNPEEKPGENQGENPEEPAAVPKCACGTLSLLPGIELGRRVNRGDVLAGIFYDDTSVQSIMIIYRNPASNRIESKIVIPCISEDEGGIEKWNSSDYLIDNIEKCFDQVSGPGIEGDNVIRFSFSKSRQEWFRSRGTGFFEEDDVFSEARGRVYKIRRRYIGGPEIGLLKKWIKLHPELSIATSKECREKARKEKNQAEG